MKLGFFKRRPICYHQPAVGAVQLRLMAPCAGARWGVPVQAEAVAPCHVHPTSAKFRAAFCRRGAGLIASTWPQPCRLGQPKSGVLQGVRQKLAEGMGVKGVWSWGEKLPVLSRKHKVEMGEQGGCASRHFSPD